MTRSLAIFAMFLCLSGCATTRKADLYKQEQKKKLALAQILLEDNRVAAAKSLLTSISGEPGVAGVTDEALFRLSLINLEPGENKITTSKAGQNLDLLIKNYPSSPWKHHAVSLKGLMDAYDVSQEERAEMEKTVRSLKNSNLSLSKENNSLAKENKELRQDMEKLKNLDLELEKKKKR